MLERLRPAHAAALAIFGATLIIVVALTIAQSMAFDDTDRSSGDHRASSLTSTS